MVLNEQSHNNVMEIQGWPGADSTAFTVQGMPTSLTYTATLTGGVKWTRTYTLGADYLITVQDSLAKPWSGRGAAAGLLNQRRGARKPLRVGRAIIKASPIATSARAG